LAAIQDLYQLKISNYFSIFIVIFYGVWVLCVGFDADIWQNVVVFLISAALAMIAFSARMVGGGDMKLFAAAALWFDLETAPRFLMAIVMAGLVLALCIIIARRILPRAPDDAGWAVLRRKGPIPYGIAIAGGAILCAHLYGFNPSA
jgi:prepilin peptidase CpaA